MELGIIGLPASGKTTIFNALTKANRPTTPALSGKLELHNAIVDVPDPRVDRLSALYKPRKTTYAKVNYIDIAGLDREMGKSGLSGQLRNRIAPMDAFVHVVRAFEDDQLPHPAGSVDPQRDLEALDTEFLLADLITVENRLQRIAEGLQKGARSEERQLLQADQELFTQLHAALEGGAHLRDVELEAESVAHLRGYGLLTLKPTLVVLNTGETPRSPAELGIHYDHRHSILISLQGKLEMEIAQLPEDEAALFMEEFGLEEPGLNRVIRASYELLGLRSFFTVGEDEVRAWNIRAGDTALDAAATVHTDLARGFIRAEVINFPELIAAGSMAAGRKAGHLRLEGKEYRVQDGDIVHVRFSI